MELLLFYMLFQDFQLVSIVHVHHFSPILLSCNESFYGISYFYIFERGASDISLLQSIQTHYGAQNLQVHILTGGRGPVLKLTIHYHLQLRLAQAQACTWTALLSGSVCPILFTCNIFPTLYIII